MRSRRLVATLSALLLAAACGSPSPQAPASGQGAPAAPGASAQQRPTVDLLIFGGTLLTMNAARDVVPNGALAIDGGEIVAV